MRSKTLERLEFEKLKEILKSYILSPCGIEQIESLMPGKNKEEVKDIFEKTQMIEKAIHKGMRLDFSKFSDIKKALGRASTGAPLSFKEIRDIGDFIEGYTRLYESLSDSCDFLLSPEVLKSLKKQIFSMVSEDGELRIDATPELYRIKQKVISLRSEIYEVMTKILRKLEADGIVREAVITIRNGRFVIPLIANFKTDGIIHGYSKSSETVYVEPIEVVSLQNSYVRAVEEEKEEIDRIRRDLSERIGKLSDALYSVWEYVGKLELYYALANFKADYRCEYPEFSKDFIEIVNGYHPLLVSTMGFDKVVPLNLYIDKRVFLVSGPNAGGKTVLLKTVGLFHLMATAGIPVPAEKAVLMFSEDVFAVGFQDEQDLVEGESSFTSYIREIIEVLAEAKEGDLVLFDELISSTDPQEASGIAYAVLEHLLSKGLWVLGNTHLTTLKLLVSQNEEMLNASMEFDPILQRPTYKVKVGEIGVSHAFEIAEKTGLPQEIIAKAKGYVQGESAILDSVIKNLKEKEALYEKLSAEYREKLTSLEEKLKRAEKIGKETAQKIVASAREEVDKLLKEIRREENRDKIKQVAREVKKELIEMEKNYELELKPAADFILEREYFIKPVGVMGVLKEVRRDKALIQIGKTFMEVPLSYLYEKG
ncbi:MAG: hypothetical protein QMD82_04820 [bacterium]|nr:hypothetical protein [bacterium]